MASRLEEIGVNAVELNLSCPHAERLGLEVSKDRRLALSIVKSVRDSIKIPLFVKLGLQDDIIDLAKALEDLGIDAVVAINTIRAIAIDIYVRKPVLSNIYGGLSGIAIHPIAVRVVYDLYKNIELPIIGVGGVEDWMDAIEFILAGASAVEIGTAIYYKDLNVFKEIIEGIKNYMINEGFTNISELIGLAHK